MIGFFGGTFDPIHFGHINMALELKERAGLKEVWICPAYVSPFKEGLKTVAPEHRLAMAKLAIEGIPGFKVIDHEIKKAAPSFTVETLRELKEATGASFRLLLGGDQIESFHRWREADALKSLAPPLIARRSGSNQPGTVQIPLFDISATEVRKRLKKKLYCGHLLPHKVLDYILKNSLY
jgi:nicotinate-nucleotide adenylyltransferase